MTSETITGKELGESHTWPTVFDHLFVGGLAGTGR